MSDIALTWNPQAGAADLTVTANDLARDDGLETAVMLSLFLDRRADDGDVLPDSQTDRRGWWGDAIPVAEGDKTGSRLWLLAREKELPRALALAKQYALEALQWLLDDKVASSVDVTAERATLTGRDSSLRLSVSVTRPKLGVASYRYNFTWNAQARIG